MIAIKEIDIAGLYFSPLLAYLLAALAITGILRFGLGRIGAYRWIWHPALFDVSMLLIIMTALVASTM
jgi:protein AaeX